MENKHQKTLVWCAAVLFVVLMIITPPIATRHLYADRRNYLGVPNTINVFSTFPFLIVGVVGAALCLCGNYFSFSSQVELWGWAWFFIGITASAFGSSYYHLRPCDARLIWDRLPMTAAFFSVVAVFIVERFNQLEGPTSFLPLLSAGLISISYWWFAEDMQMFALMQFIPSVAIPAMTIALPPKYVQSPHWMFAAAFYLFAKLCEVGDRHVYKLTYFVISGHSMKHLATAMVPLCIIIMLARRNIKIQRLTA